MFNFRPLVSEVTEGWSSVSLCLLSVGVDEGESSLCFDLFLGWCTKVSMKWVCVVIEWI